jgi:hypothetical protein
MGWLAARSSTRLPVTTLDEHVRDAVCRFEEPLVAPRARGVVKRNAITLTARSPRIEQLRCAVETIRVGELRDARPVHVRPEVGRRQALPDELVDVS